MKYILLSLPLWLMACGGSESLNKPKPLSFEHKSITEQRGQCGEADTLQSCARIELHYPEVIDPNHPLEQAVRLWAFRFLAGLIDPATTLEEIPDDQTMQQLIAGFFSNFEAYKRELPDLQANFSIECKDSILLNDGEYLSIILKGYSYTGGSHPNTYVAGTTFDCNTAQQMSIGDFVIDLAAFKKVALAHYKKNKSTAFKEGFDFSSEWPFELPGALTLCEEGLFLAYMPYEVAPYVIGGAEFVVPFEDIENILTPKIKSWREGRTHNAKKEK